MAMVNLFFLSFAATLPLSGVGIFLFFFLLYSASLGSLPLEFLVVPHLRKPYSTVSYGRLPPQFLVSPFFSVLSAWTTYSTVYFI